MMHAPNAAPAARSTAFYQDVVAGLSLRPKRLPCKYFYDARGSLLFDRICELDEYYLTRTETAILEAAVGEIRDAVCKRPVLFELGSGSSVKTRILLDTLDVQAYVPMDISGDHLGHVARSLRASYPELPVFPLEADYTRPFGLPEPVRFSPCIAAFFPGSTIGNFAPDEAAAFLRWIGRVLPPAGSLLIGVDLLKDPQILLRAYDDRDGVTAAFNKNVLCRINRELGGTIPLEDFEHEARFNAAESRVEMHLVARRPCEVRVGERRFQFDRGESLHTESSYKYSLEAFAALAGQAGFEVKKVWTDPGRLFSVQLLVPRHD